MAMAVLELRQQQRDALNNAYRIGVKLGRRFEDADVATEPVLRGAANAYVQRYTGTNAYVRDLGTKMLRYGMISVAQARGALNVMMAEARAELLARQPQGAAPAIAPAAKPQGPNLANVLDGRYRVVLANGNSISVRLELAEWAQDKPKGTRSVAILIGQDDWLTQGFVAADGGVQLWRKAAENAGKLHEALAVLANADDSLVYGLAYALAGGECCFCGRNLDTAESITVGYGPTCAKKRKLPWGAKAKPMAVVLAEAAAKGLAGLPAATPTAKAAVALAGAAAIDKQARNARTYDEIFGED